MKKYGWLVLAAILIWLWPSSSHVNAAGADLFLDGKRIEAPTDAKPEMVNGKVMVPLRVVGEQLGYQFKWEPQAYKISIQKNSTDMSMYVGRTSADVNGKTVNLDAPPVLRGNSTMVPLRFVGEQMGLKVDWNNKNKSVNLSQKVTTQQTEKQPQSQKSSPTQTQNTSTQKTSTSTTTITNLTGSDKLTQDALSTSKQQDTEQLKANTLLVQNITFQDEALQISLNRDVTPKVTKMTGPDRIVVDLAEAALASELSQQFPVRSSDGSRVLTNSDSEDVQEIRFAPADGQKGGVRIVIALNQVRDYELLTNRTGKITLQLRERGVDQAVTPTNSDRRRIVVIDPGHGGKDAGAGSVTGRHEKEFTLAVALKVKQLLQNDPDIQVVMTRDGDTYPTLDERPQLANNQQASVFVSIHGNSMLASNKGKSNGSETYYARQESLGLATTMHKHLVAATGFKDNGIKVANHIVTRKAQMPAVLLECGYLSNLSDEAAMFSEETQERIAEGIVGGLKEYLGTASVNGTSESIN
ncbi:UNVERIFIED_CONTAM: N-acetylmuramoyl-L-alanine amidase [Paenibacillus sp. PvR008]